SDPRGPGLSAHEGPVADTASRGGGRADRGGGGAERAAEHHPPGARTRRQVEGRLDASRDPARRRARPLLRRSLRPGEEGGGRRGGSRSRSRLPRLPESVNARFKFLSGARAGAVELFRKAYIGVGRHPLSDVRFDAERDLDVSSRHAAILRHGEGFVVRDLGSKNGTFLNGRQITGDDAPLNDGDIIGFGPTGPSVEFHIV